MSVSLTFYSVCVVSNLLHVIPYICNILIIIQEQYILIHDLVGCYLQVFQPYANFKKLDLV